MFREILKQKTIGRGAGRRWVGAVLPGQHAIPDLLVDKHDTWFGLSNEGICNKIIPKQKISGAAATLRLIPLEVLVRCCSEAHCCVCSECGDSGCLLRDVLNGGGLVGCGIILGGRGDVLDHISL